MSAKKKGAASNTLTAGDAQAQSMLRLNEWIQQVDAAERMSVGTWHNIPPEFTGWVFMRCGLKGQHRAEALAAQMRRMGYVDAPRGTRKAGFETDGEAGLYLCIPKQGYAILKERKRQAKRQVGSTAAAAFKTNISQLNNLGGPVTAEVSAKESQVRVDLT